jgi:HSP20 family molecular chaperone IbpA
MAAVSGDYPPPAGNGSSLGGLFRLRKTGTPAPASGIRPRGNVKETADAVVVKAEVPGMDAKDINISVMGDVLTIKGEKKSEGEEKEENYHLVERSYGSFSRSMVLSAAVDLDQIEAKYDKGVSPVLRKKGPNPRPSKSNRLRHQSE